MGINWLVALLPKKKAKTRRRNNPLQLELLEDRCVPAVANLSVYDQLLLELINRARANPAAEAARYGISLNQGVVGTQITATPKQPLAPHQALVNAAEGHARDMLDFDYFSHTDRLGRLPYQRALAAGYPTSAVGENIAWSGTTGNLVAAAAILDRHQGLMLSPGHRVNLMEDYWNEVGTAVQYDKFTLSGTEYNAIMVVENFGARTTRTFLTGVAYTDSVVRDNFYTIGEQLPGITIIATSSTGNIYTTTTSEGGGYSLEVPDGTYTIIATGPGLGVVSYSNIVVAGKNVKVDFVPGGGDPVTPPTTSGIADVNVLEDAPNTRIDLDAAFEDSEDDDSELTITLIGNTNHSLFNSVSIVPGNPRELVLDYAENANGVAILTVRARNRRGGYVDTSFRVTVSPVNDPPKINQNNLMRVFTNSTNTIGNSLLWVGDVDNTEAQRVFVLQSAPALGQLLLNGNVLSNGSTFTQADINAGRLAYRSAGTGGNDQFVFTVSDGAGGTIGATTFNIRVNDFNPVNDLLVSHNQNLVTVDLSQYTVGLSLDVNVTHPAVRIGEQLGLVFTGSYSFKSLGMNEKWLRGAGGTYYFVHPDGNLYRWYVSSEIQRITFVGTEAYDDPRLLHDRDYFSNLVTTSLVGGQLIIDFADGFSGRFQVEVTANNGVFVRTGNFSVTVTNLAPPTPQAPNRQVSHTNATFTETFAAFDADGDPITYSAQVVHPAYELGRQLNIVLEQTERFNVFGMHEKWLRGNGLYYFIHPNGNLLQWMGGAMGNNRVIGYVGPDAYANPSLLYQSDALSNIANVSFSGQTLTVDPADGYVGTFVVRVIASDGITSSIGTFSVTVQNNAPQLDPISDVSTHDVTSVTLNATDADLDPYTYSATIAHPAYELGRQLNIVLEQTERFNIFGVREKWLRGNGLYYFINPNGNLLQWLGGSPANNRLIGFVGTDVYNNPAILFDPDALSSIATLSINGQTLTIDAADNYVGTFTVVATASDGMGSTSRSFTVTVTNAAPQLPAIAPVVADGPTPVILAGTDADLDPLTYSAVIRHVGYEIGRQLNIVLEQTERFNIFGVREKWVRGNGLYYFINPNGNLLQWLGGSPANNRLIGFVGTDVYNDPSILFADGLSRIAILNVVGNELEIIPAATYSGSFTVEVSVSDGRATTTRQFVVTVPLANSLASSHDPHTTAGSGNSDDLVTLPLDGAFNDLENASDLIAWTLA